MNFSLKKLVDDHINLAYLLVLAERRLEHSETPEQLTNALPFLCACMDYLCDYPQQIHHPLENKLIEFMVNKHSYMSRFLPILKKDHEQLEATTQQLRIKLHAANDQLNTTMLLANKESLLQCLRLQLQHLSDEENQLLPLVETLMTPQDWQVFNQQLKQQAAFDKIKSKQESFATKLHQLVSLGRNGGLASEAWQSL